MKEIFEIRDKVSNGEIDINEAFWQVLDLLAVMQRSEQVCEKFGSVCKHTNIKNECEFPYGHRKVCQDCGKDLTN